MDNLIFLIYARKSARHDWNLQGTARNGLEASNKAISFMDAVRNDARFIGCNWEIQTVTVYDSQFEGQYPPTMKFNTYFAGAGMIPYTSMQQSPDPTIYNGGN